MQKFSDKPYFIRLKHFSFSRALRAAIFFKTRLKLKRKHDAYKLVPFKPLTRGYDPELLFVECAHCGAPVLWEPGKATALLAKAGIDPLELDASCMLLTEGCPICASKQEYEVRVFRIASAGTGDLPPTHGHA